MVIRLIAVGLDGTLLNSGNAVSSGALRILQVAHGMGTKIVFVSGHSPSGAMLFKDQLGLEGSKEYAVAFNGAVIQDLSKKVLMSQGMDYRDFEVVPRLQRLVHMNLYFGMTKRFWTLDRDFSVQAQINAASIGSKTRIRERKKVPRDFTFSKVSFTCPKDSDQIEKLWNPIPYWAFESCGIVRNLDSCIGLNGTGVSEGNALMNPAEWLGISPEDVMIFGNQGNDVSMFENPSFKKIAVGNVIEDVKKKADLVTDGNDCSGITEALKKFIT